MAEDKPLAINSKKKEEKMGNETKESEKENVNGKNKRKRSKRLSIQRYRSLILEAINYKPLFPKLVLPPSSLLSFNVTSYSDQSDRLAIDVTRLQSNSRTFYASRASSKKEKQKKGNLAPRLTMRLTEAH
jgi:hypothetical protein